MFQVGDILAFYGTGFASRLIRALTRGPSHVGIIVEWNGRKCLFESTSMEAGECLYAGKPVVGCQLHDPTGRIGQYVARGGYAEIYHPFWTKKFTAEQRLRLNSLALGYVSRGITYNMRGALLSGTRVFRWTQWMPVNRHEVFCSQVLHQLLESIQLVSPDNSSRYSPAALIRKLIEEETYFHWGTINRDRFESFASGDFLACVD